MLVQIPDVLTSEQVAEGRRLLFGAEWVDGRITAGHQSARAKHNLQLPEDHPVAAAAGRDDPAGACSATRSSCPRRCRFACSRRCSIAMRAAAVFGNHVDNAIRQVPGTPHRIRTDLSATLFFTDPDEYDGGELLVEDTYGVHSVKLPAGHLVLYPSTSLHNVRPVTRGARVASFFWLQSMIQGRRSADAAVRHGHGDPAHQPRRAGSSVGGAADGRLPQPARRWAEL